MISMADGAVRYRAPDSLVTLSRNLVGWVDFADGAAALAGAVLADTANTHVSGKLANGEAGKLFLRMTGVKFERLESILGGPVTGEGDLLLSIQDSVQADIVFRNVGLTTPKGLQIGPASLEVRASGKEARWQATEIAVGSVTVLTEGSVDWETTPTIDASLRWSGEVDDLSAILSPALDDLHGTIDGHVNVSGPIADPSLTVRFAADTLRAALLTFRDVDIRAHTENRSDGPDSLIVDALRMALDTGTLTGRGGGTLSPLDLGLAIRSTAFDLSRMAPLSATDVTGSARLSAEVTVREDETSARVDLALSRVTARGYVVPVDSVAIVLEDRHGLRLHAYGESITFGGRVRAPEETVGGWPRFAGRLRFDSYAPTKLDGQVMPEITGTVDITERHREIAASGDLDVLRNGTVYPLVLNVRTALKDTTGWWPLAVSITSPAVPVSEQFQVDAAANLVRERDGWDASFEAWDGRIEGHGVMGEDGELRVTTRFRDLLLDQIGTVGKIGEHISAGRLSGLLALSGSRDSLRGRGRFRMDDFTLRGMDSLQTSIQLVVEPDSITWESGPITRGDRAMAFLTGVYRDGQALLHFVGAPGARLEEGLRMGGVNLNAGGQAAFSVDVGIHPGRPTTLAIHVNAADGQILTIPFDTASVVLDGNSRWLSLNGELSREGFYRAVTENGRIPVSGEESEYDIPIHILDEPHNDVLALLLELIKQGVTGHGQGAGFVRIAGPKYKPLIGGGWVEVRDGRLMWPGSTWPMWRGVSARGTVVPGTRFLKVEDFKARVGDGHISAETVMPDRKDIPTLPIDVIGLDLGVVQLRTPRAIPFHIAGAMPESESLSLMLGGRAPLNEFTIAGPWAHPVFAGELELSDGYFTYPLRETERADTLSDDSIVKRANWQVDIVAGRDLYYETGPASEDFWRDIVSDPLELLGSMAADVEAKLVEGGALHVWGVYADGSLNVSTDGLRSERARMSVLNVDFEPDGPLVLSWDTRRDPDPLIRGRGVANLGDSVRVYARLVSTDPETRVTREGGRLDELRVELDSDEFVGDVSQQERQIAILQMLGFYTGDPQGSQLEAREIGTAAYRTLVRRSEQQAWRAMLRPFQRELRRFARLDVLDVQPSLVLNLLDLDKPESQLAYLQGTNWRVGQYVWEKFLISYQGGLELTRIDRPTVGARHQVGVEWAISPSTRVGVSRDIDVPIGAPDTRFSVTHRFTFESY